MCLVGQNFLERSSREFADDAHPNQTQHFFEREWHPDHVPAVYAENGLVVAFIGVMDYGHLIRS
jgi:hypothetical protein